VQLMRSIVLALVFLLSCACMTHPSEQDARKACIHLVTLNYQAKKGDEAMAPAKLKLLLEKHSKDLDNCTQGFAQFGTTTQVECIMTKTDVAQAKACQKSR
jgi:hypothetical protein